MRFWFLFLALLLSVGFVAATGGCSCGDDDDDDDDDDDNDDAGGDDDDIGDDDAGDDDDFPCEDAYDVIIEGETDFGDGDTSEWTAKLVIEENGNISGTIIPDDSELDPYDVTGFRNDQTTGYLDGSFPTPTNMQGDCAEATVYNHIDFTIIEGDMTGVVTFYCGEVDPGALMGTFDATGTVTCGDFTE